MKKSILKSAITLALTSGLVACGGSGGTEEANVTPAPSTPEATTQSFNAAIESPELNYSSGEPIFWDLETNSLVTENDAWELKITKQGYGHVIQVNSGVSGSGEAGIAYVFSGSANSVTDPTSSEQIYRYMSDEAAGVLSTPGGYGPLEYSVEGNHKMWPNYTTYLLEDNGLYYKAQVVGNYGEDGTAASGTLRVRIAAANASEPSQIVTLDAASDTSQAAHLDLGTGNTVAAHGMWQMAYQKYVGFKTNGGVSGDGVVQGCVALKYDELYDADGNPVVDEFKAKSADNTLADFDAVDSSSCSDFQADAVSSQFKDWYTYDLSTHTVTVNEDDSNGWILRSATKNAEDEYAYARIRVKSWENSTLVFEVENWSE
jgi:hypothetical protein